MSLTATTLPYQRETFCSSTVLTGGHLPVAGQQEQQRGGDQADRLDAVDRAEAGRCRSPCRSVEQPRSRSR